jgi:hypothetical protein
VSSFRQFAINTNPIPAIAIDIKIASLDSPAILKPEYHLWIQSQISWFDTVDQRPRHPNENPDIGNLRVQY